MKVLVLGADGYIGCALTQRLMNKGHDVTGIDSLVRRKRVEEMGSFSATPIDTSEGRELMYADAYKNFFNFYKFDIIENRSYFEEIVMYEKPDVIFHLAHQPSGPYSMISQEHANDSIINNIISTNIILWAIKENCPDCHYIAIGTTGEYDHYSNIDIEEGYIRFAHNGRMSNEMIYPRRPGSIYHACYDEKTEVLTENGWKYFKDLSYKDKIATLKKETDTLEYQLPSNIMKYDYEGDLIGIRNRSVELLVTPNHKVFEFSNRNTSLDKWRLTEAKHIYGKNCSMKRNVSNWNGKDEEFFTLPYCKVKTSVFSDILEEDRKIKMEHWLNFFGWWLTEGNVYKNRIQILQKKEYNFEEIINSFYKLQLNRKIQTDTQYGKTVAFSIKCVQLAEYLHQFGISKDRFIPKEIKSLSKRYLMILIDSMLKGDGTINDKSTKFSAYFYTQSKQLADDFQEIAIKCGFATYLYEPDRSNDDEYVVRLSENKTTSFIMSESVNNKRQNPIYFKKYYEGKVYCCEVPNDIILIRRKGKVVWCGNSKTASTYLIDYLARAWQLRCTDVQQSVVFGSYTDEIDKHKIYTRLDSDEAFGTVINRFIVQALLGEPLTIYGEGEHKRGFIALNDSIQALMIALENPAKVGHVQVWNQLSEWHSMNAIAEWIKYVGNKMGIKVKTKHIPTPRMEHTGGHYYYYVTKKLRSLGYKPTRTIEQEIEYTMKVLENQDLNALRNVVIPEINFRR